MDKHEWVPITVPWWVQFTNDVRFDIRCDGCGAERTVQVTLDGVIDFDEPCPNDEDGPWYCPHGEEVATPGGACSRCAQEDATDTDDGLVIW